MRIYLSGPMSNIENYNYPAFHEAAARFRSVGVTVHNPAENFDGDQTLPYRAYIREDLNQLLQSDAIALLDGWEKSRGARYELLTAQLLNLEVFDAHTMSVIDADSIVTLTSKRWADYIDTEWKYDGLMD